MKGKDFARTLNNGLRFCQGMIYLGIMKALWLAENGILWVVPRSIVILVN